MAEWVRWGIGFAVAAAIFYIGWRWPRRTKQSPPELTLEPVGGVGSGPDYVKTKLQLVNGPGGGTARSWQVSVLPPETPGVKLAKSPIGGSNQFSPIVRWQQDGVMSEVPPGQVREFPEFLWVEGPEGLDEVRLSVTLDAEGAPTRSGTLVVIFPSAPRGAAVRFDPARR